MDFDQFVLKGTKVADPLLDEALEKPRRNRTNLRSPSRSASVIGRLLKNQNLLENCNNL